MILTSTTEPVRFIPPWLEGSELSPTYLLRAGSVIERGQVEAELAGPHRAGRVYGFELREAVRGGLTTLLADDPELGRLLDLVEAEDDDTAMPDEEEQRLLADARAVLAEHWPPYRDLIAQLERRRQIAPILAMQRFCIGWENVPVEFARGRDGLLTEAALAAIDPIEMQAAGNAAYNLLYGLEEERNFPQPSASEVGQPTSPADTSRADGSSAKKSGRKTRASSSRRGSSKS